jgi:peptide-methionine (S)-S-oxide reductase
MNARILTRGALLTAALFLTAMARPASAATEQVVLGAGCFWCLEGIFEAQPGVTNVVSGYAGGSEPDPSYEQVGSGATGHAECIQITYDPAKTSLRQLLDVFWKSFDPTDARGVAPDFGPQYRSLILYANDEQRRIAGESRAEAQKRFKKPIATELAPLTKFYPAEEYHQDYVRRHPDNPYVRHVSIPRMESVGVKAP